MHGRPASSTPAPAAKVDETPAPGGEPAGAAAGADKGNGTGDASASPATQQPPANDMMVDLTSLGFKTRDDFNNQQIELERLRQENSLLSEYKAGPKFKSEQAKWMYDYVNQVEGMEPERARQLLELRGLDLKGEGTPDQQRYLRFIAFSQNPKYTGVSQDDLRVLFEETEAEFGDPSQDAAVPQTAAQRVKQKIATDQARAQIKGVLDQFEAARPAVKTPEQIAKEKFEYNQHLRTALKEFTGISGMELKAKTESGEELSGKLNFNLDAKQVSSVIDAIADPQGWWDRILERHQVMKTGQEQPDMQKFAHLVTMVEFMDTILNNVYQQGQSDNSAHTLKTKRNLTDLNNGAGSPPPGSGEPQAPLGKDAIDAFRLVGVAR